MSPVTMMDMFAGAGGASTGAVAAGIEVRYAANHWPLSVRTHATNHPDTEHACVDLSELSPARVPWTHIVWGSPSCTFHAQAQGSYRTSLEAEESRATMFAVIRMADWHRPPAILVENVTEVLAWPLFRGWRQMLHDLGYQTRIVTLNSAHIGRRVAQSRDRFYLVATLGPLPDLTHLTDTPATCPTCGPVVGQRVGRHGRYGHGRQYRYMCPACMADTEPVITPAATVIDWDIPGTRVGDRFRPRTMSKIELGLARYGGAPFIAELRGGGSTTRPITDPLATVTAGGAHHMLVTPAGDDPRDASARMLTPRETARAQGFSDGYVIHGTVAEQRKQIGNAVSTNVSEALLAAVAALPHVRDAEPSR